MPLKLKQLLCGCATTKRKEKIPPLNSSASMSVQSNQNGNVRKLIREMRQPYMQRGESFTEAQLVAKEPIAQFDEWFELAYQTKGIVEPNAMSLATATKDGKPSNRMVLLKGYSEDGFKFYTNYESRKGKEIAENPYAALNFFWEPLKKCIRIEGKVEKLSSQESTEYFHSRPIGSQIGSALSPQSQPIPDRNYLIEKENQMSNKYNENNPVPKPDFWGGYIVIPEVIEFWQGHVNRVHDRIRFRKPKPNEVPDGKLLRQGDNGWVMERLAP